MAYPEIEFERGAWHDPITGVWGYTSRLRLIPDLALNKITVSELFVQYSTVQFSRLQ